jgi:hypothetical protein
MHAPQGASLVDVSYGNRGGQALTRLLVLLLEQSPGNSLTASIVANERDKTSNNNCQLSVSQCNCCLDALSALEYQITMCLQEHWFTYLP